MIEYGQELGEEAVRIARQIMEQYIRTGKYDYPRTYPDRFRKNSGAFVTIKTWPHHELRGCIGYPEPIKPLIDAIVDNAVNASTRDPRFPPVREKELDHLVVEVSLLTPPKKIKVKEQKELLDKVKVGRDGLIVEKGIFRGLLLPQVPVEEGWDVLTFLKHTCWKAGMPMDEWQDKDTVFYAFQAEVYAERSPGGPIDEIPLSH